jgi:hypothetical protein
VTFFLVVGGAVGAVEIVSQLQLGRPHALSADRAGQYCVDFDGPMCLLEIRDAHG